MNANLLYVLGTAATWAGGLALFRIAFVLLRAGFSIPEARARLWRDLALPSAMAALGFLAANSLEVGKAAQGRLPVVWLVMPFAAWATAGAMAFAIGRFIQSATAITPEEKRGRLSAAGIWLVAGLGSGAWFLSGVDRIEVLKGSIGFTLGTALGLGGLIFATMAVVVGTARHSRARGIAKGVANHLALLAGSVVFGVPFAWLLITSFKEDRDMSSSSGLVWIPRVQETVPYFDPNNPIVEGVFEGEAAQGAIIERRGDGSAVVEIDKPAVLRGRTFLAKPPLKIVPKDAKVVTADFKGARIRGRVIEDLASGGYRIEVMEPAQLKGEVFTANHDEAALVRPVGLKWVNYPEALNYLPRETNRGLVYLKNTLIIVLLSLIGTLLSSSVVAYGFARLRFPGKNVLFIILLSTMMLPAAVTLIPQFLIFRWLGWIDTLRPLWVPAFFGTAFNIFLLRQFFLGIPMELEDAAKIDGCSYLRTFWTVMLPQIRPALAVVAIWTFMGAWNNFMQPLIYINSPENMPISYALQLFQGDRLAEPGLLMAFATMSMLPVLLVFFFAQRYFIEGVTLSGLGGR